MTVDRINKLNIDNRPLFTGIYGYNTATEDGTDEYFVEDNLCTYNFRQELYRYLRQHNYLTLFYSQHFGFFSYEESQLETFFLRTPEQIHMMKTGASVSERPNTNGGNPPRFIAPIASPNGKNRRRGHRLNPPTDSQSPIQPEPIADPQPSPNPANADDFVSHNPYHIIARSIESDRFFQLRDSAPAFQQLFDFIDHNHILNPDLKVALVFFAPQDINFDPRLERSWLSNISTRSNDHSHAKSKVRIIVAYDHSNVFSLVQTGFVSPDSSFFFQTWFQTRMFPKMDNGRIDITKPSNSVFYLERMGRDEIGNALQRRRITEGLQHTLSPIPFEDLTLRIWQEFSVPDPKDKDKTISIDSVKQLLDSDSLLPRQTFEALLLKMDNEKAMDKLRRMWGIESIISKFETYLQDLRACRESGQKFRPHMVFVGNPGTGKTTVARIFADVLREEGLLENGRLHQVTVGDLVSQYVGETRPKTQAVCERARGGVLFIDEAYGLYKKGAADGSNGGGNGSNQSGQEAIEVLLQFMENDKTSLVIMAGYPDEMMDMIDNGNPGLKSRINQQGFITFEDYTPDVLTKIALSQAKGIEHTPEFEKHLLAIFGVLYRFKDKNWANARTAENTMGSILSKYRTLGAKGPLDDNAIPDELMKLIRIPSPEEEAQLMSELNRMVGLKEVKKELGRIFNQAKSMRRRMDVLGEMKQEAQDLTFIFSGNPGTGKTTVARMMGKMLQAYGLLLSSEVKEYNKGDIISGIRGGTVKNVNQMFVDCIGKVMFIDEAYTLAEPDAKEAVDQIVQCMTNTKYQGKMAIVLAGYPDDMEKLMDTNVGLSRRISYVLKFEDYTNKQLLEICRNYIHDRNRILAAGCEPRIEAWFKAQKRGKKFPNAGLMKLLWKEIEANANLRIANVAEVNADILNTILPEDIPVPQPIMNATEEQILKELHGMIGLRKVKEEVARLISKARMDKYRAERGLKKEKDEIRLNFVFTGNPGTGKTTVARLMGKILAYYGLIEDPEVLTYTKANLVDRVQGGTAQNVERMFQSSLGKVLFIDEAYELADNQEAINAITNCVTDTRYDKKMAIILAGYPGDMAQLIEHNPGLKSRFNYSIIFEDYSEDELCQILQRMVEKPYQLADGWYPYAKAYFHTLSTIGKRDFGNGREAENLFLKLKTQQASRLYKLTLNGQVIPDEMLITIMPEDFPTFGKINPDRYQAKQGCEKRSGWDKLEKMQGIDKIKEHFRRYVNMLRYVRENPQEEIVFRPHMAFMGNPGTGKTTVARIFGEILLQEGLLPNSNFVAVSPSDLIGKFVGETGPKARDQFERARGGILFIDEAYELLRKDQTNGGGQYGQQAITELIQFMENDHNSIVILSGYTQETTWLIEHGNPGLKSRIPTGNYFIFEDYDADTLFNIFCNALKGEKSEAFLQTMRQIFEQLVATRPPNWGNARVAENYANLIFDRFLNQQGAKGIIGVDCIPESLLGYLVNRPATNATPSNNDQGQSTDDNSPATPVRRTDIVVDLSVNNPDLQARTNQQLENATGLIGTESGEGTGFIIQLQDRYVLTCSHVIEGCSTITFATSANQTPSSAHVIWHEPKIDLALLQIDQLPSDARYLAIDSQVEQSPQKLTELILCGYPDGSGFASGVSLIKGSVNNFERQHAWNNRVFDTIYANISATHGCSGGPVLRESDMTVVGLLQGGREGGEIQLITDVHQLFERITIIVNNKK